MPYSSYPPISKASGSTTTYITTTPTTTSPTYIISSITQKRQKQKRHCQKDITMKNRNILFILKTFLVVIVLAAAATSMTISSTTTGYEFEWCRLEIPVVFANSQSPTNTSSSTPTLLQTPTPFSTSSTSSTGRTASDDVTSTPPSMTRPSTASGSPTLTLPSRTNAKSDTMPVVATGTSSGTDTPVASLTKNANTRTVSTTLTLSADKTASDDVTNTPPSMTKPSTATGSPTLTLPSRTNVRSATAPMAKTASDSDATETLTVTQSSSVSSTSSTGRTASDDVTNTMSEVRLLPSVTVTRSVSTSRSVEGGMLSTKTTSIGTATKSLSVSFSKSNSVQLSSSLSLSISPSVSGGISVIPSTLTLSSTKKLTRSLEASHTLSMFKMLSGTMTTTKRNSRTRSSLMDDFSATPTPHPLTTTLSPLPPQHTTSTKSVTIQRVPSTPTVTESGAKAVIRGSITLSSMNEVIATRTTSRTLSGSIAVFEGSGSDAALSPSLSWSRTTTTTTSMQVPPPTTVPPSPPTTTNTTTATTTPSTTTTTIVPMVNVSNSWTLELELINDATGDGVAASIAARHLLTLDMLVVRSTKRVAPTVPASTINASMTSSHHFRAMSADGLVEQVDLEFIGDGAVAVAKTLQGYPTADPELVVVGIAKVVRGWDSSNAASNTNDGSDSSIISDNIMIIAIAGGVGGFLLLVCIVCIVCCFCCRNKNNGKDGGLHVEEGATGLGDGEDEANLGAADRAKNELRSMMGRINMRAHSFSTKGGWISPSNKNRKASEMLAEQPEMQDNDEELEDLMGGIEEQRKRDALRKHRREQRAYSRRFGDSEGGGSPLSRGGSVFSPAREASLMGKSDWSESGSFLKREEEVDADGDKNVNNTSTKGKISSKLSSPTTKKKDHKKSKTKKSSSPMKIDAMFGSVGKDGGDFSELGSDDVDLDMFHYTDPTGGGVEVSIGDDVLPSHISAQQSSRPQVPNSQPQLPPVPPTVPTQNQQQQPKPKFNLPSGNKMNNGAASAGPPPPLPIRLEEDDDNNSDIPPQQSPPSTSSSGSDWVN